MNVLPRFSRRVPCVLALSACCVCGAVEPDPGAPGAASTVALATGAYAGVHGLRMYYEVHGEGPVLVVLHGGLASIPVWPEAIDFFSRHFRVIAPEQMGHGRTADDPSRTFNYHDMAEDTAELLRQLGVQSAYFLGWSDGGIIGLDLAMNHPELVRGLAISGVNHRTPPHEGPRKRLNPDSVPPFIREAYLRLSPDGAVHWPVLVARLEDMWWSQPNYTRADLGRIKCPTLVIAGDRDFVTPEETVEIWRGIPGAELWIVPYGTHGIPKFHAEEFNANVLAFLGRAAAPAANP